MKLRNAVILTLFVALLVIGSVSAAEDSLYDNLKEDADIQEVPVSGDTQNPCHDEFILGEAENPDDNSTQDVSESDTPGNGMADNESKAAPEWKTFEVSDYKTLHRALTTGEYDKVIININSNIILKKNNIVSDSIKKLIINGNGKTINGNKKCHLVMRGDVTLKNIRMVNCYSSFGGAIKNEGKLEIISSKFEKNNAKNGAAIYNEANLIIKNTIFDKNSATASGGAICNSGTLKLLKCTIKNNNGKYDGAISNDGKLQISGCKIYANKGAAGAISNGGTAKITDTIIKNNKAQKVGIISNYRGKLVMSNSKVISNKATKKGGYVISSDEAKATIKNCTIDNNGFSSIYNDGKMTIEKSSISNNKATVDTINTMNGKLTIKNSVLNSNYAKSGGGAITNYNSYVTLIKCTINKNKADREGGAIYNGAKLIIDRCTINKNKALKSGGAIFNHGKLTVKNSKLLYNKPGGKMTIKNYSNGKTKCVKTKIK